MPNEIAANLGDYHTARATDVANETGMTVLAYERRYSGAHQRPRRSARKKLLNNGDAIYGNTAEQLAAILQKEGDPDVIMAGHSAATFDAIGVTKAEILPTKLLVATDPPGLRKAAPLAELTDYIFYKACQETRRPENAKLKFTNAPPQETPGGSTMLKRALNELIVTGAVGKTPRNANGLAYIAESMPETAAAVFFPEHSFTANIDLFLSLKKELTALRDPQAAPFDVAIFAGQYHCYFDNYKLFGSLIKQAADFLGKTD